MTPKLIADVFREVEAEVDRAQKIHPNWPKDLVYATAIVCEESGEALKEALNLRPDDPHFNFTTLADCRKELVQTAAMAVRALINLP